MDQVSTIMGADENVVEALRTLCDKQQPEIIGLVTTGLSETQGTDIHRCVREFRAAYPQYADTSVVAVNTPDTLGCLETGYALAVEALLDTGARHPPRRPPPQAGHRAGGRPPDAGRSGNPARLDRSLWPAAGAGA